VVPADETGYETVLAADEVKPGVTARDYCIAAAAGACENVELRAYQGGLPDSIDGGPLHTGGRRVAPEGAVNPLDARQGYVNRFL